MNIKRLWRMHFEDLFDNFNDEVKQKISDFKSAVEFDCERELKFLRDQLCTLDKCYGNLKGKYEELQKTGYTRELKETLKSSLDHERNLVMKREITIADLNRQLVHITARMNNYKDGYERLKREHRPLMPEPCRIQDFQLAAEVYERENIDHKWIKLDSTMRDIRTEIARRHLKAMKPYLKGD